MIKTEKLCKAFGKLQAVQEVTLSIADNSIFGLAGTNGAGKSYLAAYAFWRVETRQREDLHR